MGFPTSKMGTVTREPASRYDVVSRDGMDWAIVFLSEPNRVVAIDSVFGSWSNRWDAGDPNETIRQMLLRIGCNVSYLARKMRAVDVLDMGVDIHPQFREFMESLWPMFLSEIEREVASATDGVRPGSRGRGAGEVPGE